MALFRSVPFYRYWKHWVQFCEYESCIRCFFFFWRYSSVTGLNSKLLRVIDTDIVVHENNPVKLEQNGYQSVPECVCWAFFVTIGTADTWSELRNVIWSRSLSGTFLKEIYHDQDCYFVVLSWIGNTGGCTLFRILHLSSESQYLKCLWIRVQLRGIQPLSLQLDVQIPKSNARSFHKRTVCEPWPVSRGPLWPILTYTHRDPLCSHVLRQPPISLSLYTNISQVITVCCRPGWHGCALAASRLDY